LRVYIGEKKIIFFFLGKKSDGKDEFEFEIQIPFWIRLLDFRDLVGFSEISGIFAELLGLLREEDDIGVVGSHAGIGNADGILWAEK